MNRLATLSAVLLAVAVPAVTCAQIYDLTTDFSNALNPNGVWSFKQGSSLLTHFPQPGDANALNPAAGNGYWGVGNNFNSFTPEVIKVTQDGSATPPYNNGDFLAGDVIAHSTNPAGADLSINWTAPAAGSITYSGSVWYAHSVVMRSNDYFLNLNAGPNLATGSVTFGENRSNADTFASAAALVVNAGDVLALRLVPSSGQQSGSISGLGLTIDFTAVPEPASGALTVTALVFLAKLRTRTR